MHCLAAAWVVIFILQRSFATKVVHPTLTGTSGRIASPRYPNTYANHLDITWNIEVAPTYRIFLNFTEFDVENSFDEDRGGPCAYDYVEIKEKGTVIARYCGNQHRHPLDAPPIDGHIESCGNSMSLQFISDYSNEEPMPRGFAAQFKAIGVTCNDVVHLRHATVITSTGPPYEVGTVLKFTCDDGYEFVADNKVTCLSNGVWSGPAPICKVADISCELTREFENGDIKTSTKSPYDVGAELSFGCHHGFRLLGNDKITCQEGGVWSNPPPVCHVSNCTRDEEKANTTGVLCRRLCTTDASCQGKSKMCLCDGLCGKSCFNPYAECTVLKNPQNGQVKLSGRRYDDLAVYACDNGYILHGNKYRRCTSRRQWTGEEPMCLAFDTCGQAGNVGDAAGIAKVVGGVNANPGAWPWQALLLRAQRTHLLKNNHRKTVHGGGTVINNDWILTAAHVFSHLTKTDILVFLGLTRLPLPGSPFPHHVQIHEVAYVKTHPQFDYYNYDYDVALIRVGHRLKREGDIYIRDSSSRTITYTDYIRPICLPCLNEDASYDQAECNRKNALLSKDTKMGRNVGTVTGFGLLYEGDSYSIPNNLQQGDVKVLERHSCASSLMKIREENITKYAALEYTERMICADSLIESLHTDACTMDSGGPLVREFETRPGVKFYYQIGIVSFGKGCGYQYPGFYVSVPSIVSWVVDTMQKIE